MTRRQRPPPRNCRAGLPLLLLAAQQVGGYCSTRDCSRIPVCYEQRTEMQRILPPAGEPPAERPQVYCASRTQSCHRIRRNRTDQAPVGTEREPLNPPKNRRNPPPNSAEIRREAQGQNAQAPVKRRDTQAPVKPSLIIDLEIEFCSILLKSVPRASLLFSPTIFSVAPSAPSMRSSSSES